jgi:RNA polymerase sigma-70 factor (ECF subfamily)
VEDHNSEFEQTIVPHLDAAYNLSRWIAGNDHDAQDIVQEACLRALKFFGGFRGGNARAWLLTIVRNTAYTWLQRRRAGHQPIDETTMEIEDPAVNPDTLFAATAHIEQVRQALAQLPPEFREVIVLREMEGYSYKEIAEIAALPIGTVMSRLGRGRKQLQRILCPEESITRGSP